MPGQQHLAPTFRSALRASLLAAVPTLNVIYGTPPNEPKKPSQDEAFLYSTTGEVNRADQTGAGSIRTVTDTYNFEILIRRPYDEDVVVEELKDDTINAVRNELTQSIRYAGIGLLPNIDSWDTRESAEKPARGYFEIHLAFSVQAIQGITGG